MRKLTAALSLILSIMILSTAKSFALPKCEKFSKDDRANQNEWDGCIGTLMSAGGRKYIGEFEDGQPHGKGIYTLDDGSKYVGDFRDGTWNGQGTLTLSNGIKYVGEWEEGKKQGHGTEKNYDGRRIL